ncbi:MAG: DUF4394 domain-containing protein, partial [Planctomycetes bacterium]|nr:DUF4394 domain-containing protein [Planctomycetota bacterium]
MSLKNWWRSIRKRGNSRASQAETRRRLWAHRLRPVVERLEDRLAPAVGVQPNDIRIDLNEATGNIEVYVNGSLVSADMPSSLTVNGSSDSDAFLVDFTGGGNPIPTGGLTVNGLGQTSIPGDSLTIQGGNFGTVTYTFTPDGPDGHNGNVNLGGSVVNFTGLEPITNTGDSTISIFNLPDDGVDNQAILEDDGDLNNGMVQLRSGNGTFETTTFTNPTSDTRINASDDGETLTLSRLDNGYTASVDYFGNTGNDTLVLADGASLGAGVFDGGSGIDTIDYSAYTSPVSVNLGSNTPSLTASLDSDQEVPPHTTTPTGTATITYNNVAHTFDITLTVTGISPTDPQLRFHIHRAPTGVNGPIISDLFSAPAMTSLGTLTPTGPTSFTFTATNVPLSPLDEAALLGGITYLNVHDTAFPGGEIRGQIFPGALFVAASGTATNTGGVVNVENATGGLGDDSLVGNGNANVLQGGPGNDIIVGARGADTVQGGPAAATLLAIDSAGTSLLRFSAAAPGTILGTTPITGLVGGETIAGIDFRPATGQLYGLSSQSRLYVINPFTGAATQVGSSGAFTLNGTSFGFDFNPVPDRIRVTSDADQDLRLNPNDGTLTSNDPPLAYALGDPNFGVNPNVVGSAYTNSVAGTTTTTLYDIDSNLDILAIQNPPNNGTLNTVGPLGVDTSDVVGFDIVPGSNTALATLTVGGVSSLYTINLTTGAATLVGNVGAGTVARGLAVFPDNDILVWSNGDGSDVMDGGAGSDLVNVNGAPGADDVFTIGAGSGGRVAFARTSPGPFSLDIGTVENLTVNGIGGNDTFTVNSLAGVTSLGFINLNGFDGNDTFNVLPDANVAINVTGHLPRTAPGDTLNFNANGDPVTATANSLQTPGEQPVTFAGIETINLQNTNGSIVVNGTSGPDTLVVTATGPDSGNYSLNGGPAVNFTGATQFTFNGMGGNDLLQVNNPAGGLFAPAGGIFYNGGQPNGPPGGDSLQVLGGAHTSETHTFLPDGPDGHNGTLALVNGAVTANYTYTGLEPVLVNAGTPADIVFNLPTGDGDNQAILEDNGIPGDGLSQIRSGNGTFETTTFTNPTTSLTVNTGDDGETVTVAQLDSGFAAPITVNAGAGLDTLNLDFASGNNIIPAGGIDFNGSGNDGIQLLPGYTATTVTHQYDATLGDGSIDVDGLGITYSGLSETRGISDLLAAANRVFTFTDADEDIQLTDDPTPGNGISRIHAPGETPITDYQNPTAQITVNGHQGADTFNDPTFDTVGAPPVANLNGGTGGPAGRVSDAGDTFNITPSTITTFTIDGDDPPPPATPGDSLNVNLAGTTNPFLTVLSTPDGFTGSYTFGNRQPVNFQEIETLANTVDLSITKTDGQLTDTPGTTLTYTIVVSNNGPLGVAGATVADLFPAVLSNVTFTSVAAGGATGNTAAGMGNINDTVTLPVGSSITYMATGTIDPSATGTLSNTATVTPPGGATDSNTADNSATDDTALTPVSDIQLTKADAPDPVVAGTNLTYTITVSNAGPSDAQNIQFNDAVPANTTFVSFMQTSGPAFTVTSTPPVGGTGTVTASIATLAAGASATFTFVVNVNANTPDGSTISNTATAFSGTADPNTANNSDTETTAVIAQADLAVTKTDSPDPVVAGTNLTYTLTVSNAGPSDAQNVSLSDLIPANTTFVSAMQTSGPAFTLSTPPAGGTGTFSATGATLAAGASATFTLVVNVNANTPDGSTISNTASVSSSTTDTNPANNSDTETTAVIAQADLAVTKTDSPDPVVAGTNLTYTITVSNAGPSDAQNVVLSDAVPANTTFVSFTTAAGFIRTDSTPVGGTGTITATAATLAAGASATFTLVVNVNASAPNGSTISNTASVSSSTTDTNAANDSATEPTAVIAQADLAVTKTDSPDPVVAGTNLTYTITVS